MDRNGDGCVTDREWMATLQVEWHWGAGWCPVPGRPRCTVYRCAAVTFELCVGVNLIHSTPIIAVSINKTINKQQYESTR